MAAIASVATAAPAGVDGLSATLILTGGRIWTGDPAPAEAEAVAVLGETIVAVGSAAEVARLRGERTRVIELRGRRVVPGFIDSHVHFLGGGEELLAPDLRSARSEEELAARLGEAARKVPAGTWLVSGAWDHESWAEVRLPRREVLDRHTPEHPVFVSRIDGHMAVANSLALRLAGVTRETSNPPGGEIVRDPVTGEPAGVLRDAAMGLVSRHVPPPGERALRERALAALRHAASLGVTGVHDVASPPETLRIFQELRDEGKLTLRITLYPPLDSLENLRALGVRRAFGDDWIRVNGLKAFADGSLGSSTALFFEPYLDSPETRGLAQIDLSPGGLLEERVRAAVKAGLQPAVHAIGDAAIRSLLDIFERVAEEETRSGRPPPRFRVEHAQHIHPDDLPRFARIGAIASMQPYHAADDGRWAEKRIGRKRCETTYAFRDLLDHGTVLAFGSDWPVAPLSPFAGIHAAVTRQTLDGKHPGGWIPRQKITVEEAVRAYTQGAARAAFAESRLGRIAPGLLADLVVLAEDIFAIDPARLAGTRADLTIAGGRVVYEAEG